MGRDFLPRGSGIVTRRPLILQLINIPKGKAKKGEKETYRFENLKLVHGIGRSSIRGVGGISPQAK